MNENDLNKNVSEINDHVAQISRKVGGSWLALWRGILTGFGYIIGALIAVIIIGWVLNIVGVIPAFKNQVESLKNTFQQAQTQSRALAK